MDLCSYPRSLITGTEPVYGYVSVELFMEDINKRALSLYQ